MFGRFGGGLGLGARPFAGEVAPEADPHWASVALLLGYDLVGGGITTDESSFAHAVGMTSDIEAWVDPKKFGEASGRFGQVSAYITFNDAPEFELASNPFTFETWFRTFELNGTIYNVVNKYQSFTGRRSFRFQVDGTNGSLRFESSITGAAFDQIVASGPLGLAIDTWYHIAVDGDASTIRLYLNGNMVASGARTAIRDSVAPLRIGAGDNSSNGLKAFLDETRLTVGVARYASDNGFAVPSRAYPRA